MTRPPKLRTWIEIDRPALTHNIGQFRALLRPETRLAGVIKSNAYGHDFVQIAHALVGLGVDWLMVDSMTEALRLRREGLVVPLLVLGYTLPENVGLAIEHDIELSVSTLEALRAAAETGEQYGRPLAIHLKLDTGMCRQGFDLSQRGALLAELERVRGMVTVRGVFTHFAAAKNPALPDATLRQIQQFEVWQAEFASRGYEPIYHASATSGTLLFPQAHYDLVRVGIGLYGLWPSGEARQFCQGSIDLRLVLSWKTVISEVKTIPAGARVGYDGTEMVKRPTRLAVCPIGYWHGFSRTLSGIGEVLVGGQRAKVIGRVSMDMITIDVTDITDVQPLDEVVLIGRQGAGEISVYDMAAWDDTSWYETVTRINPLIRRIYV